MATMNKEALYGIPDLVSGEYGPKDKLYNNNPGLAVGLSFPAGNNLTGPAGAQNLKVMLVADGYDVAQLPGHATNNPRILANGSTSAGAFITFPDITAENFAQVLFDITAIGPAPAALLAESEAAGPMIVVLGADGPGSTTYDGADYVLIGPLHLGTDSGGLGAFKVMPGSQYTQAYQADKDPGSRTSRVDALQIKVPSSRRDLARAGSVSTKIGAGGNIYLDEMLDAFAGSLARMKDIRGGTQWDADSAKWHVDGDAYDDGKGLFHIDSSLALDVPGGIKSGDGAWIDHDGLSGQIVEFEQKFSSDGAHVAGVFSAPLSWLAAYNDLKIRAHLGRLFADSHPEFVAAGSAENWFLSKVSAGTGGLTGVGGDAIAGAGVAVPGTGTHAISTDMVVPGLLRDMGTTVGGTVPEGSNAEPSGIMRNVDTNDAASAYMQETRAAAGVKLDYMRFGYGNDSVRKLLDAGFDTDSVFTDGSKKGVDIFAALVELKAAGGGSGADGVISNVSLVGNNLTFTGAGGAYNSTVDLSGYAPQAEALNDLTDVSTVEQDYGNHLEYSLEAVMEDGAGVAGDTSRLLFEVHEGANPAINSLQVVFVDNPGDGTDNTIVSAITANACVITVKAAFTAGVSAATIADVAISGNQNTDLEVIDISDPSPTNYVAGDAGNDSGVQTPGWSAAPPRDNVVESGAMNGSNLELQIGGVAAAVTIDLSSLLDDTDTNNFISAVSLVGNNLTFVGSGGAYSSTVNLSSLAGGGGSEEHAQDEVAISGATIAGTDVLFNIDVHPATDGDDAQLAAARVSAAYKLMHSNGNDGIFFTAGTGYAGTAGDALNVAFADSGGGGATGAVWNGSDTMTISWDQAAAAVDFDAVVALFVGQEVQMKAEAFGTGGTKVEAKVASEDLTGGNDVPFKDKMAVYVNGVRQSKNDYVLSHTSLKHLKFDAALDAGDYIIIELKAATA